MNEKNINDKKYWTKIIATLIVIAIAVSAFVYSMIMRLDPETKPEVIIEDDGYPIMVSPGPGTVVPSGEPNFPEPTFPPPGE